MNEATAKYLFDEDFAAGEKPTITLVEPERRRADAELQAYRKALPPARSRRIRRPPSASPTRSP